MQNDHHFGEILGEPDVLLIGGGIMSATLGTMLKRLNPAMTIQIAEALPRVAQESSQAWNNAGTGHAALCELNYTPETKNGSIDISKAVKINEQFETSKHFWAYLVRHGIIANPGSFIQRIPHMSFVRGENDREFLRRRHAAMVANPLFETMEYTDDRATIAEWAPLLLQGRADAEPLAATRAAAGTDVNYGNLTRNLFDHLVTLDGVALSTSTRATGIKRVSNGGWEVVLEKKDEGKKTVRAGFVFIGAGGGSLPLLQKSGIPEGKGFGGFPVSGQFLVCKNKEVVDRHAAKVYGKAAVGAPPMSVPHLDARLIDGKRSLLFGPYAGFSPKFLKTGSNLDLIKSVKPDNLGPLLAVGRDNMELTRYLINECRKSHAERCASLREFFPGARDGDWGLIIAGQRVQTIKRDPKGGGQLQFGTEVVAAKDGTLATILGASPGASTSVSIILDVLEKCFPTEMAGGEWPARLAEMVPAHGKRLAEDKATYSALQSRAHELLKLDW